MSKARIYLGNLSYSSTKEDVHALLEPFGVVHVVELIIDRETGRPRGFGFAEMDEAAAQEAIAALDHTDFAGRTLIVRAAEARRSRSGGGDDRQARERDDRSDYARYWNK